MLLENIFESLFSSSNFFRITFPHIESKYFYEKHHELIFDKIKSYSIETSKQPTISVIKLLIESDSKISELNTKLINDFLDSLHNIEKVSDETIIIKQCEEFCQNRALELAIYESVEILKKNEPRGAIEDKIKTALAVEFDIKIGHDYFIDSKTRLDSYFCDDIKLKLDIDVMNLAMGGGLVKKGMFIFMANTNVGKCVLGNTQITVRNKTTGLIETLEISEFFSKNK